MNFNNQVGNDANNKSENSSDDFINESVRQENVDNIEQSNDVSDEDKISNIYSMTKSNQLALGIHANKMN